MARNSVPGKRNDPIVHKVAERLDRACDESEKKSKLLVPSGSVMLNLACSNNYRGAYEVGRMVNFIGDSNTGKTYLALEMLAQCAHDKRFDQYNLIYDDSENALSMDISELFGDALGNRIMPPKEHEGEPMPSRTIEDFHCNLLDSIEQGSCIYVLDSFDALTSEQDEDKIDEMREARAKGKEIKGSYRMAKPKKASELLQDVVSKLDKTNSLLMIISQTRDNIDPMSFEKKTRSGGRALKFYASHEIWLAVKSKVREKERIVGAELKAKVTKNKLTGTFREVEFDFRHGYGCDDISSVIDFLIAENVISGGKKGAKLVWRDIEQVRKKFIDEIESRNLERLLFRDAQQAWNDIEESLKPNRKSKYGV